jgi:hypothetical protein
VSFSPHCSETCVAETCTGSVLAALVSEFKDLRITALVRKPNDHAAVQAMSPSIKVIAGDKSDHALIQSSSAAADIVISAMDNNDVALTKAIIAGLEQRTGQSPSKKPVLISTGGTGVLGEGGDGNFLEGSTVDDSKAEDIKAIPADRPHRAVDLEYASLLFSTETITSNREQSLPRTCSRTDHRIRHFSGRRLRSGSGPGAQNVDGLASSGATHHEARRISSYQLRVGCLG